MVLKRSHKVLIGMAIGVAFLCSAVVFVVLGSIAFAIVTDRSPQPEPMSRIEIGVDPGLDSSGGVHPVGMGTHWIPGTPTVYSEREKGGWLRFAAYRESARRRVEQVELRVAFAPAVLRAEALARWYTGGSTPFFPENEYATDLHGVIAVDADRLPAAGEDRIIAYTLDGLRDGKPVHFEGKILASAGELNTVGRSPLDSLRH